MANIEITARNNGYRCTRLEAALAEKESEKRALVLKSQRLAEERDEKEKAAEGALLFHP